MLKNKEHADRRRRRSGRWVYHCAASFFHRLITGWGRDNIRKCLNLNSSYGSFYMLVQLGPMGVCMCDPVKAGNRVVVTAIGDCCLLSTGKRSLSAEHSTFFSLNVSSDWPRRCPLQWFPTSCCDCLQIVTLSELSAVWLWDGLAWRWSREECSNLQFSRSSYQSMARRLSRLQQSGNLAENHYNL